MGAIAAKMGGIGKMKSDVDELKKKMALIEGVTNKLKDASKQLTEKADGAMKAKDQLES